jgi:hypothetical protein
VLIFACWLVAVVAAVIILPILAAIALWVVACGAFMDEVRKHWNLEDWHVR